MSDNMTDGSDKVTSDGGLFETTQERLDKKFTATGTENNWSQCTFCIHLHALPEGWKFTGKFPQKTCNAYPEGIPSDIFFNHVLHTQRLPGDNGIMWETVRANQDAVFEFQPMRKLYEDA